MRMKQLYLKLCSVLIAVLCDTTAMAQSGQLFTVTTLNVDGLPAKILFLSINEEGPGEKYTKVISQYLTDHPADFIGVQENFNFNNELNSVASSVYDRDEFSGNIDAATFNFTTLKVPCDGLSAFWQKRHKAEMERIAWTDNYGKFDHSNDDLCTKGFRRYELTTESGVELRLYNMHMDASSDEDEAASKDGPDRDARLKQWKQLRDDILERMDAKPVIVLGDMNSYYARDEVKVNFIDAIEESGHATVSDVWIELERGGQYPEHEEGPVMKDEEHGWFRKGETLDKILYINPAGSSIRLLPTSVNIDRTGYVREDGSPLGDHFPLSASFVIEDATTVEALITDPHATIQAIYTPDGRKHATLQRGLNIVRMSDGTTRKIRY